MSFLAEITAARRLDAQQRSDDGALAAARIAATAAPPARDFAGALCRDGMSLIAEIKRASPSVGAIDLDIDPAAIARRYEAGGAAAISVLTEPAFFRGSLEDLRTVRDVVALPVLRLRGIYLALLTLACAILADSLFFGSSEILGGGESLAVPRPVGGDAAGSRTMFVLCAVACVVFANVFLLIRRSALGRQLNALRDSPMACQTMGLSLVRMKLIAFGLSAAMAGAAGAFLGALQVRVGQFDFYYFRSLAVLLVVTIFGITSVSGALLAALFFVVLPRVLESLGSGTGGGFTGSQALQPLIIGGLAMYAARNAGGISGTLRARLRRSPATVAPAVEVGGPKVPVDA